MNKQPNEAIRVLRKIIGQTQAGFAAMIPKPAVKDITEANKGNEDRQLE